MHVNDWLRGILEICITLPNHLSLGAGTLTFLIFIIISYFCVSMTEMAQDFFNSYFVHRIDLIKWTQFPSRVEQEEQISPHFQHLRHTLHL